MQLFRNGMWQSAMGTNVHNETFTSISDNSVDRARLLWVCHDFFICRPKLNCTINSILNHKEPWARGTCREHR